MIETKAGKEYSKVMKKTILELEKAQKERRSNNLTNIIDEHTLATNNHLQILEQIRRERILKSRNGFIYHPAPLDYNPKLSENNENKLNLRLFHYQETKYEFLLKKLFILGRSLLNYLF